MVYYWLNMGGKEVFDNQAYAEDLLKYTGSLPAEIMIQLKTPQAAVTSNTDNTAEKLAPTVDGNLIFDQRPTINAPAFLAEFKTRVGFRERDGKLQVLKDVIGMIRHLPGGGQETYTDKLQKEEEKGKTEAASYGLVNIGGHQSAMFGMHWDFFAGTLGVVAGEKFAKACDLATRKKLPLVGIYSSGGARQQENFPALVQMTRMVHLIRRFKERVHQPYTAVLLHQVWGGISASAVPLSDFTVALEGTDFGFSGPRVIESYEYKEVPKGAQSAEANVGNRNLDLVLRDQEQLIFWLNRLHSLCGRSRNRISIEDIVGLPPMMNELSQEIRFPFGYSSFETSLSDKETTSLGNQTREEPVMVDDLYARFVALRNDPRRPDTEYLLRQMFTDVVPLYNRYLTSKLLSYPAIIAALGRIGPQAFLIIGNQPSYQRLSDRIVKIPSSPAPADFNYMRRMLRAGERLGFPAIFFTDTLGAKPTLDAEVVGQSREIAEAIEAGIAYKHPVISIITGVLGSGGGLAITPMADHVAMLNNAMAFVAEPTSATSIIYNKANPSREEVEATVSSMRAKASDQYELRLIDTVIEEPEGGAWQNPLTTAEAIRGHIARTIVKLNRLSPKSRMKTRDGRIRNLRGIELKEK